MFSIVVPTRDRPRFVELSLRFLMSSSFQDFEVIVADNPTSTVTSCMDVCRNVDLNLVYSVAVTPLSMRENWNRAYSLASGDYVAFLTDKMWLLPHTLTAAANATSESSCDLVSWIDSIWQPASYLDYFGSGMYYRNTPSAVDAPFSKFEPREVLATKLLAATSRSEMSRELYALGKICFGAYRRDLCDEITARCGALFPPGLPDYTSMAAALVLAKSGVLLPTAGCVQVNSDFSTGGRFDSDDEFARAFISSENTDLHSELSIIPGLYTSSHALVAGDYQRVLANVGPVEGLDLASWLAHIADDLDRRSGTWSSQEVQMQQRAIFDSYLDDRLTAEEHARYMGLREKQMAARSRDRTWIQGLKGRLAMLLPPSIFHRIQRFSDRLRNRSSRAPQIRMTSPERILDWEFERL